MLPINLRNTKRKILGNAKNRTRGYRVRGKCVTSVLCSPPLALQTLNKTILLGAICFSKQHLPWSSSLENPCQKLGVPRFRSKAQRLLLCNAALHKVGAKLNSANFRLHLPRMRPYIHYPPYSVIMLTVVSSTF